MSIALPLGRDMVHSDAGVTGRAGRVAVVDFHDDLAAAEPIWRDLESQDAITTPYQRYDFIASWYRYVGRLSGTRPLVVAAYDQSGRPLLLWPFGRMACGPVRTLQFLGGKHANTNLGVWDREFAASATPADIHAVVDRISAARFGIDLLALHRQPMSWDGLPNPLRFLPHQPAPSDSCRRDLGRSSEGRVSLEVSRGMRKQLRGKQGKLAELPGYRYFRAATPEEVDRLLAWFFPVKATHLAAQGLPNAFAEPGIEEFVRDICHRGLAAGRPVAELHAIEGDGAPLAVFGGTGNGHRFSSMFNTYTPGPHSRYSPGLVLLTHIVADLGERGFTSLDLGAGDAEYKRGFCREPEPLFDTFVPLTGLGRPAAVLARSCGTLKRRIKRTPRLWSALQTVRRHLYARR